MSNKTIRYILAEDEPPIRKNLIKKIERLAPDFSLIGEASGGKTALEMVKEERPHILFTDIRMPGIDGLELMRNMHSHYPDVLIVVISGYNDFSYAQQSIRLGVSDYLLKPIDLEQLNKALHKLRQVIMRTDAKIDNQIKTFEDTAGRNLAARTAAIIQEKFRENISVQELADDLHINSTYLSRTFKDCYGMTPSRFIQEQRMNLAKRLLNQYPEMEIKEIAAFTGYTDQNYFSRVFKKETGMSPIGYRINKTH